VTPSPALFLVLLAFSADDVQMNLSPSLELGGGYDSNILLQNTGRIEGAFNQTSSRFDLDLRVTKYLSFITDYEILYINYSAGVFSSLDNFVAAGFSIKPLSFLTFNLVGQYEIFDPSPQPEYASYAFNRVVALPTLDLGWKRLTARGALYYSLMEFPKRPPSPSPPAAQENQVDKNIEPSLLLGYAPWTSTALGLTYSYIVIRSNLMENGHHTLNSLGHGITINIWQALWRKGRVNLRLQYVTRDFEDSIDPQGRRDKGLKASFIFRQKFIDYLEGFVSMSQLWQDSNNRSETYEKAFAFIGLKVLFDPVRMDRLWREELSF